MKQQQNNINTMDTKIKPKSFVSASTNEVTELLNMLQTIDGMIKKDYLHVSHLLSDTFKNSIKTDIKRIAEELDRRD